ncbi:MAG: hypothetical protein KF866_00245 [Phycisphaeraceae bacterium]|nr:hypothetical protein [Phycisphaeraceae bacterium]MCW5753649.1 hypothetical protein [Phycisphaeraceae bacterium]
MASSTKIWIAIAFVAGALVFAIVRMWPERQPTSVPGQGSAIVHQGDSDRLSNLVRSADADAGITSFDADAVQSSLRTAASLHMAVRDASDLIELASDALAICLKSDYDFLDAIHRKRVSRGLTPPNALPERSMWERSMKTYAGARYYLDSIEVRRRYKNGENLVPFEGGSLLTLSLTGMDGLDGSAKPTEAWDVVVPVLIPERGPNKSDLAGFLIFTYRRDLAGRLVPWKGTFYDPLATGAFVTAPNP